MSIDTLEHLRCILKHEPGAKGICVLIGAQVHEINQVVSSDEGVILRCANLVDGAQCLSVGLARKGGTNPVPSSQRPPPPPPRRVAALPDPVLRVLAAIVRDLPQRRDWLNPDLEREARELTGVRTVPVWTPPDDLPSREEEQRQRLGGRREP